MNRNRSMHLCCALAALAAILVPAHADAGTFSVDASGPQITVEAKEARIEEILAEIGLSRGFDIEQIGDATGEPVSGRFSGPLLAVMDRILQNQSHVIVHSKTAPVGIARILLLDSNTVPDTPTAATPAATPGARVTATAALAAPTQGPQPLAREVLTSAPGVAPPVRTGRR
jgi:hypothetical protein